MNTSSDVKQRRRKISCSTFRWTTNSDCLFASKARTFMKTPASCCISLSILRMLEPLATVLDELLRERETEREGGKEDGWMDGLGKRGGGREKDKQRERSEREGTENWPGYSLRKRERCIMTFTVLEDFSSFQEYYYFVTFIMKIN